MTTPAAFDFQLQHDAFGRLVYTGAAGERHEGVVPVRAFPIAAPDGCVSLVNAAGQEVVWIERLADLPASLRRVIDAELAQREFVPEIRRLVGVSSFATPSTWTLETDRGPATLVLKGEEDIRRVSRQMLMVADSHGIQYLIRDLGALDRHSRRLLDRFL